MNNSIDVIERLKEIHDVSNNLRLSEALGVSSSGVKNWKLRNVIPYKEVCNAALEFGVSLEWLLTGKGEKMESKNTARLLSVPHYAIHF